MKSTSKPTSSPTSLKKPSTKTTNLLRTVKKYRSLLKNTLIKTINTQRLSVICSRSSSIPSRFWQKRPANVRYSKSSRHSLRLSWGNYKIWIILKCRLMWIKSIMKDWYSRLMNKRKVWREIKGWKTTYRLLNCQNPPRELLLKSKAFNWLKTSSPLSRTTNNWSIGPWHFGY